jgi:transcriptional/translational regulatory protein YebC/TACO1
LPKGETPIADEDMENYNKFMDMLNFLDDVQHVFTDAKLPD